MGGAAGGAKIGLPARPCCEQEAHGVAFAEELAQRQGIELELENDLRELHFGAWEGPRV
ncbi:histidine phosphatase family protein, partial [Pseudomonas aeruginosa]